MYKIISALRLNQLNLIETEIIKNLVIKNKLTSKNKVMLYKEMRPAQFL